MARRSHLTAIGSIAGADLAALGADLAALGAGRREGWLDDPNIAAALHAHHLALANQTLIFVLDPNPNPNLARRPLQISPDDGPVTALEWLAFGPGDDLLALAVATADGFLLLYNLDGNLIHKQFVHGGRVLKLRFREVEGGRDSAVGELCVVFNGVIARFEGSDIQNAIKKWYDNGGSMQNRLNAEDQDYEAFYGRIPFQLWNVGKYGSCVDAAITGLMPPPLLELQISAEAILVLNSAAFITGQSSQRYFCAVTIGADAVISAYRLSEDRSRSLVGAILSRVVPAAFSTISSFSKLIWRSEPTATNKSQPTTQPFAKASALTCLKDSPRKGVRLTLSPSGTLAAIADNLGRVLLLDTQALVAVRIWKGYRDASCFFVEMLVKKDKKSFSESKNDYCLCLAIHAPRKGIIEIWKMRTGPRLLAIQCPKGSKILQPSTRSVSSSQSSYNPLELFLLNGDSGQLSVLNRLIA